MVHTAVRQVETAQAREGCQHGGRHLPEVCGGQVQNSQAPHYQAWRGVAEDSYRRKRVASQKQNLQVGQLADLADCDVTNVIAADVKSTQVDKPAQVVQMAETAAGHAQEDEPSDVGQLVLGHPAVADVQVPCFTCLVGMEGAGTGEGQSVARAVHGAGHVTEKLVVLLGTLVQAVAHVTSVQTRDSTTTAIEAGARVTRTARLVLAARTVGHSVTPEVDG